jgi:hypothetical protein
MAALARFLADDCVFSSDEGTVITKAQYLGTHGKLPVAYDYSTNPWDFVVRLHVDAAVINSRTTHTEQFGDTDIISEQRRTETWLMKNGARLLIAIQWKNLPVNSRKPITVDVSLYKDYVGAYESRAGDDSERVFLKDGRLWSEAAGDVAEYLPAGPDAFF